VAHVPNQPSTAYWYAATSWDGVYRSTDDGLTWFLINTGLTDLSMSSIGLDETGNGVLAGTGYGGVYRSSAVSNQSTKNVGGLI